MAEKFLVEAVGRLTHDPEGKYLPNGTQLVEFTLATTKDYKNKTTDEWVKNTIFSRWQAWGDMAGLVMANFNKGQKVSLKGDYAPRSWTDKESGEKRTIHNFRLSDFILDGVVVKPEVVHVNKPEEEDIPF